MSENVTNELILEHLKAIQGQLTRLNEQMASLQADFHVWKSHVSALVQSEVRQDGDIATMQARLERIERRLELGD